MGENIKRPSRAENAGSRIIPRWNTNYEIARLKDSVKLGDRIRMVITNKDQARRIFTGYVVAKHESFFVLRGSSYNEAYLWTDLLVNMKYQKEGICSLDS